MELDSKPTDYGSHDKIVSVTAEEIFLGSSKEINRSNSKKKKINGITEATQKHIKLVRDGIAGAYKINKDPPNDDTTNVPQRYQDCS